MSSACYVYAIVGRDTLLPTHGRAAELVKVACQDLAAVTGLIGDGGTAVTMEAVLRHEAIVETLRRQGPALPVRFGTVFPDLETVAAALADRYQPLQADLARVGDKVELGLTALWAAPPAGNGHAPSPPEAGTVPGHGAGARYLKARAAELLREGDLKERAQQVAGELDRVLGIRALEQRVALLPTPRIAVRADYLLDPADVPGFQDEVDAVGRGRSEVRLVLTGPWPPYSFVQQPEKVDGLAPDATVAELARMLIDATRDAPASRPRVRGQPSTQEQRT